MRKLIITLLIISGFLIDDTNGQSIDKSTTILGDWYACGLRIIQVNDTATFFRTDSVCTDKDCLYFKWGIEINGEMKSGIQEGCDETKIGFDLRKVYKWTLDSISESISIKKSHSIEVYKILILTDKMIKVFRQK